MVRNLLNAIIILLLCTSCINRLNEIDEQQSGYDKIYVNLSSRILQVYSYKTRMLENSFEADDEIGLFVLKQTETLSNERHIDNAKFTFNGTSFISTEEYFYPNPKLLTRFISYYPFNETGVASENETLLIETLSDQSTNENYGLSDFMTAKTENITPSNNEIGRAHV